MKQEGWPYWLKGVVIGILISAVLYLLISLLDVSLINYLVSIIFYPAGIAVRLLAKLTCSGSRPECLAVGGIVSSLSVLLEGFMAGLIIGIIADLGKKQAKTARKGKFILYGIIILIIAVILSYPVAILGMQLQSIKGNLEAPKTEIIEQNAIKSLDAALCGELEESRGGCYRKVAEAKKDPQICEMIANTNNSEKTKASCYQSVYGRLAQSSGTISYCSYLLELGGIDMEDACIQNLAVAIKNASLCTKILDCRGKLGCYEALARNNHDISICSDMEECADKDMQADSYYCYVESISNGIRNFSNCRKAIDNSTCYRAFLNSGVVGDNKELCGLYIDNSSMWANWCGASS